MTPGLSRRRLLARAAAAVPVLAGASRLAPPAAAQAAPTIVKPLPPEWFVRLGTNAEMRWDAARDLGHLVPNERFFVRNHTATAAIECAGNGRSFFASQQGTARTAACAA